MKFSQLLTNYFKNNIIKFKRNTFNVTWGILDNHCKSLFSVNEQKEALLKYENYSVQQYILLDFLLPQLVNFYCVI